MKIYGVLDEKMSKHEIEMLLRRMADSFEYEACSHISVSFADSGVGLGHSTLRSADRWPQPIWNPEKTRCIVMNGKIFDYREQKEELERKGYKFEFEDNDAEFVLCGFEEHGINLLKSLNGVFTFAIWDCDKKELTIANDRYGMKPIYYYHKKGRFVFASEIKAILEDHEIRKEINWSGLADLLAYGYLLSNKTLLQNVFALPNASILNFEKGKFSTCKYWNYDSVKINYELSENDVIRTGKRLFKQAIERQAHNLNEAVVLLSGGFDSRFICSSLKVYTKVEVEAFTAFSTYLDRKLANRIARRLGIGNVSTPPLAATLWEKYYTKNSCVLDGMVSMHLWIWPLLEKLDERRVCFDGIAGDILLDGFSLTRDNIKNSLDDSKLALALYNQIRLNPLYEVFSDEVRKKIECGLDSIRKEIEGIAKNENRATIFFILNRTKNAISLCPNNLILRRTHCYFPFLDNEFVEFCLSVPPKMKLGKKIYYRILKSAFPEIMKIPSTNIATLRGRICRKMKEIAIGTDYWIPKPSYIVRLLAHFLPESLLRKGVRRALYYVSPQARLNAQICQFLVRVLDNLEIPPFIDRKCLKNKVQEHGITMKDLEKTILPIMGFCVWYDRFMVNRSPKASGVAELSFNEERGH